MNTKAAADDDDDVVDLCHFRFLFNRKTRPGLEKFFQTKQSFHLLLQRTQNNRLPTKGLFFTHLPFFISGCYLFDQIFKYFLWGLSFFWLFDCELYGRWRLSTINCSQLCWNCSVKLLTADATLWFRCWCCCWWWHKPIRIVLFLKEKIGIQNPNEIIKYIETGFLFHWIISNCFCLDLENISYFMVIISMSQQIGRNKYSKRYSGTLTLFIGRLWVIRGSNLRWRMTWLVWFNALTDS